MRALNATCAARNLMLTRNPEKNFFIWASVTLLRFVMISSMFAGAQNYSLAKEYFTFVAFFLNMKARPTHFSPRTRSLQYLTHPYA